MKLLKGESNYDCAGRIIGRTNATGLGKLQRVSRRYNSCFSVRSFNIQVRCSRSFLTLFSIGVENEFQTIHIHLSSVLTERRKHRKITSVPQSAQALSHDILRESCLVIWTSRPRDASCTPKAWDPKTLTHSIHILRYPQVDINNHQTGHQFTGLSSYLPNLLARIYRSSETPDYQLFTACLSDSQHRS